MIIALCFGLLIAFLVYCSVRDIKKTREIEKTPVNVGKTTVRIHWKDATHEDIDVVGTAFVNIGQVFIKNSSRRAEDIIRNSFKQGCIITDKGSYNIINVDKITIVETKEHFEVPE